MYTWEAKYETTFENIVVSVDFEPVDIDAIGYSDEDYERADRALSEKLKSLEAMGVFIPKDTEFYFRG